MFPKLEDLVTCHPHCGFATSRTPMKVLASPIKYLGSTKKNSALEQLQSQRNLLMQEVLGFRGTQLNRIHPSISSSILANSQLLQRARLGQL